MRAFATQRRVPWSAITSEFGEPVNWSTSSAVIRQVEQYITANGGQ